MVTPFRNEFAHPGNQTAKGLKNKALEKEGVLWRGVTGW